MELKNYDYTNGPYFSSKKYDIHPLSNNGFTQYIGNESYMHQYLNNHYTDDKINKLNKELDGKNIDINHDIITNNRRIPIDNIAKENLITISNNNINNANNNNFQNANNNELTSNNNNNSNNNNFSESEKRINNKIRPKSSNVYSQKSRINLNLNSNVDNYNNNNNNDNPYSFTQKNSCMNSTKNSKSKSKLKIKNPFNNNINNYSYSSNVKFLNRQNNPILNFDPFKNDSEFNKNFTSKSKIKGAFDLNNIPRLKKTNEENNNNNNLFNQFTKRLIQTCKGRRPNNFEIKN